MFHKHKVIADMQKNMSSTKITYEGIKDLAPEQISLQGVTDEVEMPKLEQGMWMEKLIINEEEMEITVI